MTTIELKEISCYLAYGLQMMNTKSGRILELQGAYNEGTELNLMFTDERNSFTYDLWPFKPLVIPLSELTDEQWVEVFKAGTGYVVEVLNIDLKSAHCFFNATMYAHYYFDDCEFRSTQTFSQLLAFQKLFELHADVFDWISRFPIRLMWLLLIPNTLRKHVMNVDAWIVLAGLANLNLSVQVVDI